MQRKHIVFGSGLIVLALLLVACGGTNAAPVPTAAPANPPVSNQLVPGDAVSNSSSAFEAQTVEGGGVAVKVKPLALQGGAPLEFEIAMDTHSVDLAYDMLKAVALRDDAGKEYSPMAWGGPAGGGHHRAGNIKFAPLTTPSKSVMLIVKNIGGVPERTFQWNLAQ